MECLCTYANLAQAETSRDEHHVSDQALVFLREPNPARSSADSRCASQRQSQILCGFHAGLGLGVGFFKRSCATGFTD